jgi:hypothetical protein
VPLACPWDVDVLAGRDVAAGVRYSASLSHNGLS